MTKKQKQQIERIDPFVGSVLANGGAHEDILTGMYHWVISGSWWTDCPKRNSTRLARIVPGLLYFAKTLEILAQGLRNGKIKNEWISTFLEGGFQATPIGGGGLRSQNAFVGPRPYVLPFLGIRHIVESCPRTVRQCSRNSPASRNGCPNRASFSGSDSSWKALSLSFLSRYPSTWKSRAADEPRPQDGHGIWSSWTFSSKTSHDFRS